MALVKDGLLTHLKSGDQCPSFGAAAGRSWTPTAMVTVRTAGSEVRRRKARE